MTDKKKDNPDLGATFCEMSAEDAEKFIDASKDVKLPHDVSLEDELNEAFDESDITEEDIHKAILNSVDGNQPDDENPPPSWLDDLGM